MRQNPSTIDFERERAAHKNYWSLEPPQSACSSIGCQLANDKIISQHAPSAPQAYTRSFFSLRAQGGARGAARLVCFPLFLSS